MKRPLPILLSVVFVLGLVACQSSKDQTPSETPETAVIGNPPAEGFDTAHSDPVAIEIADQVMEALGGRQNWDETRYLGWNFFGRRVHIWDRYTGKVRINYIDQNRDVIVNIHDGTGRLYQNGAEVTHPDSLTQYLPRAKSHWINDAYWLVMPYKLKDSGVTLKYAGKDTTENGRMADKLVLTFKHVGDTPQNKYDVYVDEESHLVTQWAYYPESTDEAPRFITPWDNYQRYGKILLSGDRGRSQLSQIHVWDSLPDYVFNSFDPPIDLNKL